MDKYKKLLEYLVEYKTIIDKNKDQEQIEMFNHIVDEVKKNPDQLREIRQMTAGQVLPQLCALRELDGDPLDEIRDFIQQSR